MTPDSCLTCDFFSFFTSEVDDFVRLILMQMGPSAVAFLWGATFFWAVWQIFQWQLNQTFDFRQVITQVFIITIISSVLTTTQFWWEYFYNPVLDFTYGLSTWIMRVGGVAVGLNSGIEALVYAAESPTVSVRVPSLGLFQDNVNEIVAFLGTLVLTVLYFWIAFNAARIILRAYMRFLLVTGLSPLFLVLGAYGTTRTISTKAISYFFLGVFDMLGIAVIIGFANKVLGHATQYMPATADASDLDAMTNFIMSAEYVFLIFTALAVIWMQNMVPAASSHFLQAFDVQGSGGTAGAAAGAAVRGGQTASKAMQASAVGLAKAVPQLRAAAVALSAISKANK